MKGAALTSYSSLRNSYVHNGSCVRILDLLRVNRHPYCRLQEVGEYQDSLSPNGIIITRYMEVWWLVTSTSLASSKAGRTHKCISLIWFPSNKTRKNMTPLPITNLKQPRRWTSTLSIHAVILFFLSLNLLIGWQLSIWICCKPFFSLLYNCQLLCFWRLASSIVVEVFPWPFFQISLLQGCLLQTRYA
jgi:hypothetical protein